METCKQISLEAALEGGRLWDALDEYLERCRSTGGEGKRGGGSFPNIAGFCRFLGCGLQDAEAFRLSHPAEADRLNTVLEDEAFNCGGHLSPTLLSAYLKHRLGYGDKSEAVSGTDCGEVRVIFEHDVAEDGA
ncbi:MAG: hypothetical protein IKC59_08785 [Clostridia bacterium]|nr:hypothetical protein [Clostridia bacterium]